LVAARIDRAADVSRMTSLAKRPIPDPIEKSPVASTSSPRMAGMATERPHKTPGFQGKNAIAAG